MSSVRVEPIEGPRPEPMPEELDPRALRKRVLEKFAQSLHPGGFLCLGAGERLPAASPFSEFAREERIFRYQG